MPSPRYRYTSSLANSSQSKNNHSLPLEAQSKKRSKYTNPRKKYINNMIDRYSRPQMRKIWTEENKFNAYLEVEILAAEAWSTLGAVPKQDVALLRQNARFDVNRIHEIEEITRHDVVAFTRAVSESLGEERKWVHYGLTSTDVVDTANGYLLKQANTILREDLQSFAQVLRRRAYEFQYTPVIGRTHGMHADVTSFGLKWALWYEEMQRNIERFEMAARGVEAGKLSGAVGNYANIPPEIQTYVCEHLGIESAAIATQVLGRDRHAFYIATLAVIAGTLEQMALEVRNMQRQEVREVEEAFRKGQKGSSAMPHKRNPISSENICGCARVMRGYMCTASENIALWHERDISHSSTEPCCPTPPCYSTICSAASRACWTTLSSIPKTCFVTSVLPTARYSLNA